MKKTTITLAAIVCVLTVGALAGAQTNHAPAVPAATVTPIPTATPTVTPPTPLVPTPGAVITPSTNVTPGAVITPTPAPSPNGTPVMYKYVVKPTPAPNADPAGPKITEIDVIDQTLHAPGTIAFQILTSPAVKTVTAILLGHEFAVPQISSGVFAVNGQLPSVPFFILGTHPVDIVAADPDGKSVTTSVSLRLSK